MYLIAIAWMYVVLMMSVAEALSTQGSVLGAVFTFLLYGLLPLGIVLYIVGTPGRRKIRRAAEATAVAEAASAAPDGSRHAAGEAIPAERKEP
jgi:mannose/fructose/N-acetylgalactosamine-specific phosphotransferase system component IID